MKVAYIIFFCLFICSFAFEPEFCWKDSYGRGVGTIPQSCSSNRDRIGLLCYTKCPSGMSRFVFDCHSVCPSGWADQGLFCRNSEYGRGAGYPWKFGDGFNSNGQFRRCENDNGAGNCEKNGLIVYPKCKSGYNNFGCCICRPSVPNCPSLNLNPGIDLSCAKKIIIGDPVTGTCSSGQDKNAGICYPACSSGYHGVGPVCWGGPPSGWVDCGMGAAKDSKTCASVIFGQITSIGCLALNIATLGSSGAATEAASSAEKAGVIAKIKEMYSSIKTVYDANKELIDTTKTVVTDALKAKTAITSMGNLIDGAQSDQTTIEDITRNAALLASVVDPTGVASVVAAYTYPKCSAYFH